jgi:hypothetical protein
VVDAVLSYHTNPATCGVAKFNQRLARELGVPILTLDRHPISHPLVSIKTSEWERDHNFDPFDWTQVVGWYKTYDVFLHDNGHGLARDGVLHKAGRVYAANPSIANHLRMIRSHTNVIDAWCPSTIEGNPNRGEINVLTFGMAHKIQAKRYERLKELLDETGKDYTVSVSTAIHEGSPWDETALVADELRTIFGSRLRVLGYLADDALSLEMARCSAIALFFDPALRANNTTFWAALDSGAPVVTNLDADSPQIARNSVFHIDHVINWPSSFKMWHNHNYSWSGLKQIIQEQPCAK